RPCWAAESDRAGQDLIRYHSICARGCRSEVDTTCFGTTWPVRKRIESESAQAGAARRPLELNVVGLTGYHWAAQLKEYTFSETSLEIAHGNIMFIAAGLTVPTILNRCGGRSTFLTGVAAILAVPQIGRAACRESWRTTEVAV